MKKIFFLLFHVLVVSSQLIFSQKKADVGITAGGSYYLGDINAEKQFFQPSLSYGALFRYNINDRYAIRTSAYYLHLKGTATSQEFPQFVLMEPSFNTTLVDIEAHFEFNFLPYTPAKTTYSLKKKKKLDYTPYIAGGIGFSMSLGGSSSSFLTVPFGMGIKFNITERLSAGAEWILHKTFIDEIDGLNYETIVDTPHSIIHNNDWYSVSGLFITYKFFKFAEQCPVYF